ncbi:50S ribosomal protein L13 [bacterium]|nr:50S ribosomal protein L13 [bacterium]MBQ6436257.1 50S ribosomal protein L13 [bacterium]
MKTYRSKTTSQRKEDVQRAWILVDGKDRVLGQLATEIAEILQGKNKATYSPHVDGGDYVVLINASQIQVTRAKAEKKTYVHHSNYPGGLVKETFAQLINRSPDAVIRTAVKGMLPNNKLKDARLARLKVFPGSEHSYKNYIKE